MTCYSDLTPCDYFDHEGTDGEEGGIGCRFSDSLLAVGWLDDFHEFPRGSVDPGVRRQLVTLREHAHVPDWSCFFGYHFCDLCIAGGYVRLPTFVSCSTDAAESIVGERSASREPKGVCNLFIPGRNSVFVAPELIVHYIDAHGYVPPAEFCEAVLECPPMGTDAYFAALRRVSSGDFGKALPPQRRPWWRAWPWSTRKASEWMSLA